MRMDSKMKQIMKRIMKHSRRTTVLASILILVTTLWTMAATDLPHVKAAANNTNLVNGSVIQHQYLTIQVMQQNKKVSIQPGMTKKQVDQLLGQPTVIESSSFKGYTYGSTPSVSIGYINDKVSSIRVSGYNTSLNGQFKFGTPWKNVLVKLGQPSQQGELSYSYVFQLTNGKLKQIYGKAIEAGKDKADIYILSFSISKSGNIESITVEQAAYTKAMEDRLTKSDPNKPTFKLEEIIGITSSGDKKISLGMNRQMVEEQYGKSTDQLFYSAARMDIYGAISVYYREDTVAAILVDPSTGTQTNSGLHLPATRDEVLHLYGEPSNPLSLDYDFEAAGGRLQVMDMFRVLNIINSRELDKYKYLLKFFENEKDPNQIDSFILHDFDFLYDEMGVTKPQS